MARSDLRSCDVLVVGGGPAGSTAAWALRRAGLDVVVLDRARFPRDKLCAGWVTPQAVAALELDLVEFARGRVLQPVTGVKASRIGGRAVESRYGETISYGIRRCEFDHYLLQRSGARVLSGALQSLNRSGGDWIGNDTIRAPLVVGAGGHFCPVARSLGAGSGERPVVVAQEVEFRMSAEQQESCRVQPEVPELLFCADLEGYGWVFRKGAYLNVGFGRRDPKGFPAQLRAFQRFLAEGDRVPAGVPSRWPGHSYLVYEGSGRKIVDDGVLLVGDAAGLAYPQSGEGIGPAIESGLLAARAVVAAGGRYTRERLEAYRHGLESRYGRRPASDSMRLVPGALRNWIGGWVLATPRWSRRLVVDRWFLHRGQPALA